MSALSRSPWTTIHQFVPAVYPRDAIGGHVTRLRNALLSRGVASEIYVEEVVSETAGHTKPIADLGTQPDNQTLNVYHMATGSGLVEILAARTEPLVTVHHNLTPLELMAPWDPTQVHTLTLARRQLERLAGRSQLGIGVSAFNTRQLVELGFASTDTVPLMFDFQPRPVTQDKPDLSAPVVLFVGRVAPNKGHHDLIAAMELLGITMPDTTLHIVGAPAVPTYQRALDRYVASLGLQDRVVFTGSLSDTALDSEYARASVVCCLSDHEGVGMPIIEAMHRDVPVVAFAAGAVRETAGGAALMLESKDPATVATALERVISDEQLAGRLRTAGHYRVRDFQPDAVADQFVAAINRASVQSVPRPLTPADSL